MISSEARRGVAALLALLAVWCAAAHAEAARPLTLWHAYRQGGAEERALAEILARSPEPVEVLAVPFEGYATKLHAAISHGDGPDVFLDAHERIGDFVARGLIVPLPSPSACDGLARAAVRAVTWEGQLVGVPIAQKTLALYLNSAQVPEDTPDLEALFERARPAEGGVVLGHASGSAYAHAPFASAFGAVYLGPGDTFGLATPAGASSIEFVAGLTKRGLLPDDATPSLVSELFGSGRAAAAIGGPWMAGDLRAPPPYRVVPLPRLRATGRPMRPFLTVEVAFLTPRGRERAAAGALVAGLASEEAAEIRARVGRTVTSRAEPTAPERTDPFLLAFARAAATAEPMPSRPAMRLVFEPADRALRKVLRGDATAAAALDEAAHRFDDVRRPLPPRAAPAPYAALVGVALLGLVAVAARRARDAVATGALARSRGAYGYVAPATIAILALVVAPLVAGAAASFFAGRGDDARFVGFAHYVTILTARGGAWLASGSFYLVLLVTVLWTAANITLHVLLGGALGLLLSRRDLRGKAVYRVLLIVPWAVPSYVTALAWKGMFHRQLGAVNALLALVGVEPVSWFSRFSTAFSANLATNVWLGFPFFVVVTMGALTSVPDDVLEAAAVDGATRWERLWRVTLPMIRPVLAPAVALGAVWTFNMFNVVFLVSGGDPDGTTDILVSEAYRWAFAREAQIGYAAAYSVLIFALLFAGSRALGRRAS
ncbi:MAG: extracellular solute-binding protein [Polyangiaceae bacterium]|nr:extracellular solute-binding protein [Polyangiaceae bacterium]